MAGPARAVPTLLLLASTTGCVFYQTDPGVPDPLPDTAVAVATAIRAHLDDGGVVLFREGARVGADTIAGAGWRYDFSRLDSARVDGVSMGSVVGLESAPDSRLLLVPSVLATAAVTAGAVAAAAGLAVAIFGSCPTVYASEPGGARLEAELFSYSIAPLLEGRDVDALGARAAGGVVRLDVRNEALETHFINHLQLLELRHERGERAVPDPAGLPVAVTGAVSPASARDRDGRAVAAELAEADGVAFETSPGRLEAAVETDLEDAVELVFPRPAGAADSAALVLRLRNSLLNTVLFYDMMLADAGAEALTWLGSELQRIGPAVSLGRWWVGRMGMRVEVLGNDGWAEAARLADTGPIAWTEVAVPLALSDTGDSVRIRLRFVADEWRIDRAALASYRRPEAAAHPVARVLDSGDGPLTDGVAAVAAPDERYLETRPGDRIALEFDVGPEPDVGTRSFLLSSQGYYTEWIRPAWVRQAAETGSRRLEPGDAMLREAMRRWAARRPSFEREFFESRIPTR